MLLLVLVLGIYFQDSLTIPGGYLNGVAFDGEFLWVTNNASGVIYKIDKEMQIWDSLQYFSGMNGIAFAEGLLWVGFYTDNTLRAIDPQTGETVLSWSMPGEYSYGVAFDGNYLWHSSKASMEIRSLEPSNGTVIQSFRVSFEPKDLGFGNGRFWAVGREDNTDFLFLLDSGTGEVVKAVPFPRPYPAGIASYENTLWVSTTAGTGKLYAVDILSVEKEEGPRAERRSSIEVLTSIDVLSRSIPPGKVLTVFSKEGRHMGFLSRKGSLTNLGKGYYVIVGDAKWSPPYKWVLVLGR